LLRSSAIVRNIQRRILEFVQSPGKNHPERHRSDGQRLWSEYVVFTQVQSVILSLRRRIGFVQPLGDEGLTQRNFVLGQREAFAALCTNEYL